jgi:hypothetical protein
MDKGERDMATVIGASAAINPAVGKTDGASPVALQAQLDRCTTQLGDWIGCASGKTPAGQKVIEALEQKISDLKAKIEAPAFTQAATAPATSQTNPPTTVQANLPVLANSGTLGTLLYAIA